MKATSVHESNTSVPAEATRPPVDPFFVDADGLHELASEKIVLRGVTYFKEHRVTGLDWEDSHITATVEGSDSNNPYVVEISKDDRGELVIDCSCPFDWEPVCKHAVATLMSYAAHQPVTEQQVSTAAEEAVEARVRRGKTEVVVKHVTGAPAFGTWTARSVSPTGGIPREYRVQIRSLTEKLNRCSCPDFATNQLGTCKHIEAVLHKLSKRRGKPRKTASAAGVPVIFLDWDTPSPPKVRVRRPKKETSELMAVLDRHFDAEGLLRGELPGALTRFRQNVDGLEVDIGDDAIEYAERVGERAAQRERAARVRTEIIRSGGQIPGVRARLYPYQVEGVAFLAATGRALLADDMGLGKTLQSIAAAVWLREQESVERTLIVCPASLKHQWAREIRKFTDLEAEVVQGGVQARKALYRRRADFTIVNYELVLRDHETIMNELMPDLLVLDEAQRIKNWRTKTATAVKRLTSRYAFVLSGTPLENRLEDLYSVMQVVDSRVLGPLWRYMLEFHVTDERGKTLGYRNLSELRRRLEPVLLRRDRRLVEDQLPPRVEQQLDVAMSSTQIDIHNEAMQTAAALAQIAKRRPLTPSEEHRLMAALQTARMACDAAGLVDGKTEGSPKLAELERLLEEICVDGGEKVVIFSQWEKMTRMVQAVADRLELGVVRLHGGIPTKNRGALISRFEKDPGIQVFLSTDAGGVGLNLQAASVVINLDLPFNPAVLDQRIGRVHRLGQKRTVRALLLVSADSYEQRIGELIGSKRELFSNVLEEGTEEVLGLSKKAVEAAMASLSEEDMALSEEELAEASIDTTSSPPVEAPPAGAEELAVNEDVRPGPSPTPQRPRDADVSHIVTELQRELGNRLERVMVTERGMLAVVDAADRETHELAELLSQEVPLAIVDRMTFAALRRLGTGTPAGAGDEVWRKPEGKPEPAPHPLELQAQRKLEAAEALAERQLATEAAGLLSQALLARMALNADQATPPAADEAALWLYGEAVPRGVVTTEDAAIVLRAEALSRAPSVPPAMIQEVLEHARRLVLGGSATSAPI